VEQGQLLGALGLVADDVGEVLVVGFSWVVVVVVEREREREERERGFFFEKKKKRGRGREVEWSEREVRFLLLLEKTACCFLSPPLRFRNSSLSLFLVYVISLLSSNWRAESESKSETREREKEKEDEERRERATPRRDCKQFRFFFQILSRARRARVGVE